MAEETSVPGSAIIEAWETVKRILGNQRGEAGVDGDETQEKGWTDENAIPPADEIEEPKETPEETPEEEAPPEKQEEEQTEETPEEEVEKKEKGSEEEAGEDEFSPEMQDLTDRLTTMEENNAALKKTAEFYQQQYNQMVVPPTEEAAEVTKQPGKEATLPDKHPEGVSPPGEWDGQIEMGAYIDSRIKQMAGDSDFNEGFKAQVEPVFQAMGQRLMTIAEHLIKSIHPDYDEVVKAALEDAFVFDPSGNNIGPKNQALINLFNQSPFPHLTMYEHGLSKRAPEQIKEGIKKQTQTTLKKIAKKPKTAITPKKSSPKSDKPELDWNTPSDQVEVILKQQGLT